MISVLLILLIPIIFGSILLSLLAGKVPDRFFLIEKIALSFALGLAGIVLTIYFLGILNIPITFINSVISMSVLSALCLIYIIPSRSFIITFADLKPTWEKPAAIEIILLLLIAVKTAFVFFSALIKPMIDVDAFQYYSIIAKGIFYDKSFTLPYLQQFLGDDKPLFPYLTQGWVLLCLDKVNDQYLKLIPAVLFLLLLVIFYSVIRKSTPRKYALFFTWLLSTLPFIIYHATTAYADLTITFYYCVGTFYLFLAMKEQIEKKPLPVSYLLIGAGFTGLTMWVKKAGLILMGINIFVFLIFILLNKKNLFPRYTKPMLAAFLLLTLIISPLIFSGKVSALSGVIQKFTAAGTGKVINSAPAAGEQENRLPVVAGMFLTKAFLYGDWQLLWGLFIFAIIFFYKSAFSQPFGYLLTIILLDSASVFMNFYSSDYFKYLLDGTLLDRLVMNSMPLMLFFCAFLFGAHFKGEIPVPKIAEDEASKHQHSLRERRGKPKKFNQNRQQDKI